MAVIVEHVETQTLYVVVGSGYALASRSKEDAFPLVACADGEGAIRWFYASQLSVELVDGRRPGEVLSEAESVVYEGATTKPAPARPSTTAREPTPERSVDDTPSTEKPADPPVDPKDVVGTSADLWRDDRPL